MRKYDVESIVKRIIKGESIRKIAKDYKVHKYYLFSYIIESDKYNGFPIVGDMFKFKIDVMEIVYSFIRINNLFEELDKKVYKEFNIGIYDLEEYSIEYQEIKSNDSKLLYQYKQYEPYIKEFESIYKKLNDLYEDCSRKFKIDCSVDKKEELDKILESYQELEKVNDVYNQTMRIMNLIEDGKTFKEACEIANSEFKTYITYDVYTKNYNLMGYGMNAKTRQYYFKDDKFMREVIKEKECAELKREMENIEFKRGYKTDNGLNKELEIIATEKGLTMEEFTRGILLKYLDSNYPKVRELE